MFNFKSFYIMMYICLIFTTVFAFPGREADATLTADQKELQADLEHNLVAPCCWNMTVDQHDSPKSRAVREKITDLIKEGKSKDEVLSYFSAKPEYGERILASPSQETLLGKSAYWLIPVAILLGSFLVISSLRKWSKPESESTTKENTAEKPENSNYSEKVEDELKAIE